ncbi:ferric reductase transmembrane component 3 [[Candida] jaroonii]|uniref:Ferric reductase transmembrane component 3 n=1 Tax=[Candida] jaroonii TaxID=467808 RepID=A0ACA9Y394_9ASCO|nr:ferric reductase transmembrane component 3 [[Candida] jaroonii]
MNFKLWIVLAFINLAFAKTEMFDLYSSGYQSFYACSGYLEGIATFCGPDSPYQYEACTCGNKNMRASFMACVKAMYADDSSLVDFFVNGCSENFAIELTKKDFEDSYDYYLEHAVDVSNDADFNMTEVIDYPVVIDPDTCKVWLASYKQFLGNYNNSYWLGIGLTSFWAAVLLMATVYNWTIYLFPSLNKKLVGPITNKIRKYITIPAIGRRRAEVKPMYGIFDALLPTRGESVIIGSFTIVCTVFCAWNIKPVEGDTIFGSVQESISRQIAVRTGILASAYMPLLILFAGRNNFLQWLTRWKFSTFIMFHRWIGRIAFILVTIHSIGYSITFTANYKLYMKDTYVIWGFIATISAGFIVLQGLLQLRRNWYEIFLIIHIILAALFIGGAWLHVVDLGYVAFYYACVGVWVLDRVIRFGRLFAFGFPMADVELFSDETFKVTVPKPSYWKSIPGGHAFVHFLRPSCFWQSHPFTFTNSAETENEIVLYIKIKGGLSHGLYQHLAGLPGRTTKMRVGIEGPYGESAPAKHYDNAVFIAGGNGIPGIYSEAWSLAQKSKNNDKIINLIWIIRDSKSLEWFSNELRLLKDTRINTTVYITKPNLDIESSDGEKKEKEDGNSVLSYESKLSHIIFKYGRPSLEDIVKEQVEESRGSTAFVTCGNPIMVDDLRYFVSQNLHPEKRVDFFEQLQVWA